MIRQVFINELKASFNLRNPKSEKPTNLYLVCRIDKKQVKFATGVKVYPEHWNEKKQEAFISCRLTELDNVNNSIVNDKISEIKNNFIQYKQYLCANPEEINNGIVLLKQYIYKDTYMKKQEVNAIHWLRSALTNDRTVKESTKMDYIKQLKFFETFLKEANNYPISFDQIKLPLLKDYETYLFNKDVGNGKTTKTTTVGNKVEKIICILRRAEQQGLIDIREANLDKYKKPQSRQGDDNEIYLTEEEINRIYALELTGMEEQVRDLFVLQCWIGQRFADTQSINDGLIKDAPNGKVIEIVQEKKTHKVSIPLLPIALEILDKYECQFPIFTNQTALNYLKNIGKKAGITRMHNVTEDRGGKVITERVKAYELIGTHTARRSFVSNMLKRGYDSNIIMKITGHNDERSFKKYIRLSSEDAALLMLEKEADRDSTSAQTNKSIGKSKQKIKVLDYLFAESSLLKLSKLQSQGINIYDLAETQEAIRTIKDTKRTNKVKEFLDEIDKLVLYDRTDALDAIIWNIAKHYIDFTLYQIYQQKVIELGLSISPQEITDADDLTQLWQQEYANEELERHIP